MVSVLVVGYKAFELGIFDEKDLRLKMIKTAIRRDLIYLLENGMKWLVFTGNLGFESWVLDVAKELQEEYNLQLATIFLFENQGENWNEANQEKLDRFKKVDFVKFAYPKYENPSQFREYNQFLLENTDGAYLFYDEENETKLKYHYQKMKENEQYAIKKLTFDDLNEIAENFSEI